MRTFAYYDLDGIQFMTEKEVLDYYFDYWSGKMKKVGKESEISKENCIQDFLVINWGWEVKQGEKIERKLF